METFFWQICTKISAKPNITPLRGRVSPRSKVGKSIIWRGCEGTFYPRGRQRTFSDEKYYWNIIEMLLKYYLKRLWGSFLPTGQTKDFLRWEIILKFYRNAIEILFEEVVREFSTQRADKGLSQMRNIIEILSIICFFWKIIEMLLIGWYNWNVI